ncbi:hypothetical protein THTE_0457 [Thermogutta terrifontis]|uniref:Uncharacterized protein n=1 Tax=Thermogutta terrifontis TaxID=1331910 RepID=A0A286RAT2_9BACT|nr:hypothetical protein THTE_0457 [Thermogutta terrifontis]
MSSLSHKPTPQPGFCFAAALDRDKRPPQPVAAQPKKAP